VSSPARISLACVVLVAAFGAALLVGRGSGGEAPAAEPARVKPLNVSEASVKSPELGRTGKIPDLKPKPEPAASTPSTGSSGATGAGTTGGSTGGGSTGGGSTGGGGGTGGGSPPPPPPSG
jgi:uncharacterized membrane protein YgcG